MQPTIAEVIHNPGRFSGTYRICRTEQRTGQAGWQFSRAVVTDSTGNLTCYGWPNVLHPLPTLTTMSVVAVTGNARAFNGGVVADLSSVVPLAQALTPDNSIRLLPLEYCASPAALPRLIAALDRITSPRLRQFVGTVFANDRVGLPFLRVPASIGYHHAERGGLLEHTVEGLEFITSIGSLSSEERDYALVGFTFHDVAKTIVYTETDYAPAGHVLKHDALTLELCAPALAALDMKWSDAALTLRHIWTCESPGSRYGFKSANAIADLVHFVDRWSAERDKQRRAFRNHQGATISPRVFNQRFLQPRACYYQLPV